MNLDREHAERFLTDVFAGQLGLIQICSTGNWAGEFFPTSPLGIRRAVDYAAKLDARRPAGIYFRATTVKAVPAAGKRGSAADTRAVPTLWGDLDYGTDGHKGTTLPPTADAARMLPLWAGLPAPSLLVHSGGGYYPLYLTDQLTADNAEAASVNLQQLFLAASVKNGWNYGTGVSDLARVLRLPGSLNRKIDTERPCRVVGGTGAPVDVLAFPQVSQVDGADTLAGTTARPLPPRRNPVDLDPKGDRGAFDVIAERCAWADILEPAGWTFVAEESDGAQRWLRPGGATSEYSARCFEHNMVCHSESAGLPVGAGQRLTKGRVFAYLWYGGDFSAAGRDLVRGVNTGSLPGEVIDEIGAACRQRDPFADLIDLAGGNTTFVPDAVTATADELQLYFDTYTRCGDPRRLARRIGWMNTDPAARLPHHARALVADSIAGHYPADSALAALSAAYRHHGDTTPGRGRTVLSAALAAVLNQKVSA